MSLTWRVDNVWQRIVGAGSCGTVRKIRLQGLGFLRHRVDNCLVASHGHTHWWRLKHTERLIVFRLFWLPFSVIIVCLRLGVLRAAKFITAVEGDTQASATQEPARERVGCVGPSLCWFCDKNEKAIYIYIIYNIHWHWSISFFFLSSLCILDFTFQSWSLHKDTVWHSLCIVLNSPWPLCLVSGATSIELCCACVVWSGLSISILHFVPANRLGRAIRWYIYIYIIYMYILSDCSMYTRSRCTFVSTPFHWSPWPRLSGSKSAR